jgi:hypothetical protein
MPYKLHEVAEDRFTFIDEPTDTLLSLTRDDIRSINDQVHAWETEEIVRPIHAQISADTLAVDRYHLILQNQTRIALIHALRKDFPQLSLSSALTLSRLLFSY